MILCRVEIGTMQDDTTAHARDIGMFDSWGPLRHDDGRRDLQMSGRVSHTLSVVPRGASNDTFPAGFGGQMSHLVVGAPQFEREDWEEIFTLEEDLAFQAVGQVDGVCEGDSVTTS